MIQLRQFQKQFVARALADGIDTACLSLPRGNGKSWLAGHLLERCLTPGDGLHVAGSEYLLCAGSIEQARLVYRFIRANLEPKGGYRFVDSATRIGITHLKSFTRLRVLSSNGRTAMGIVGAPLLVADEPGSWEVTGGSLMHDAITTAQGKPGSPLKVIYIGTLAPASSGWWHDLVQRGTHGSTYVQSLQGQPEKWDQWPEIRRCNPLSAIDAGFRKKLLEERDEGRADSRLKARFMSYRLNVPTADESELLLTVDDLKLMFREVPERQGRPIVSIDLGAGRAWSAAVAIFEGGRIEAMAVCPGVPALDEQEKRDRVPPGTYVRLAERGLLEVADGLMVPPPELLWDAIKSKWGLPMGIVCDRFQLSQLRQAVGGEVPIAPRQTRWSESSEDIKALRGLTRDGPFAAEEESRPLLAASLSVARVKNDDAGGTRLVKRGFNNEARDDVAAALVLAAGKYQRLSGQDHTPRHAVVG